jgi:cytoskeletal protein CcmA (bactofilin family)
MANETGPATDERRVAAWIGRSLRVEGKIVSQENLTIDGHVDGTIEVGEHTLTIGPGAKVKADLIAKAITISGAVTGNVTASTSVDLRPNASVEGDIRTPKLAMADGATVRGHVDANARPKGTP